VGADNVLQEFCNLIHCFIDSFFFHISRANPGSGQIDRHGDNCSGESGLGSPERAGPAGEGEDREAGRCCAFPFVSVSEQKQHLTFQLRRSEPPLRLGTTTANGPRA